MSSNKHLGMGKKKTVRNIKNSNCQENKKCKQINSRKKNKKAKNLIRNVQENKENENEGEKC